MLETHSRLDQPGIYAANQLANAARDASHVSGLTHTFYRYPARFSPKFVRAAIELFSEPGDLILDPFVGGGTSLVEAMAMGRHAVGTDISSLAAFISTVKTTLLSDGDVAALTAWSVRAGSAIASQEACTSDVETNDYYQRNLDSSTTAPLREAISRALTTTASLQSPKLEAFARCVVLRSAQWALDSRKTVPDINAFQKHFSLGFLHMIQGADELSTYARSWTVSQPKVACLHRSAVGLETDENLIGLRAPKLVVTSPPYPGVHVLYHRWQVDGRKETPAPFWIANKKDGSGASFYTMGDRKERSLNTYYDTLLKVFSSIAAISDHETTIVQMVAFANPADQLPRYMEVMRAAGFVESDAGYDRDSEDGRLWRDVPNRRWHAGLKGGTSGSKELVLVHRLPH